MGLWISVISACCDCNIYCCIYWGSDCMSIIDIDFIKWLCEKAEGFDFLYGKSPFEKIMSTVVCESHQYIIKEKTFKDILYPLLLQRAIEGVNRAKLRRDIWMDKTGVYVIDNKFRSQSEYYDFNYYSIGVCKEKALIYVKEIP